MLAIGPEIAARPQLPDDVAVAGPVGVIDLDRPVLGAQGDDQVVVFGRPAHGVGVQPVARDRMIVPRRLVLSHLKEFQTHDTWKF